MLIALSAMVQLPAAESDAGTWTGTWQGAGGSGSFDIVLTRGNDGSWTGSVAVGTDMGNYSAKFSRAAFAALNLSAAYD